MLCKGSFPIRLPFLNRTVSGFGLDIGLGYREYKNTKEGGIESAVFTTVFRQSS